MPTSTEDRRAKQMSAEGLMMPEKDPSWWGPAIAVGLGLLGGAVRLLQGWHGRKLRAFDFVNAAIDLFGSAFISMIAYMLAVWWLQLHPMAGAALGGVAGHIGTRASIIALEQYIKRRLKP